jgi:hypothetical protein
LIITLESSEMIFAINAGAMRRVYNLQRGLRDKYGLVKHPWQADIEGAMAEMAVAKAFDVFWSGSIGKLHAMDAGNYQVRYTPYETGHLVLNPADDDSQTFIFVTGGDGQYHLRGYAIAGEVKLEEFYTSKVPGRYAYFVPQDMLRPIEELRNNK